jgi:RNA polymerase sigma-70 factor (ECF subfamily)
VQTTSRVSPQDDPYQRAAAEHGAALGRLARGYEADPDKQRDLLQEVHVALWRSFSGFRADCSLRTWVYRVAHNTAISWVTRQKRARAKMLVSLDEVEMTPVPPDADRRMALERLTQLVQRLEPRDREVILAYLEGMDAAAIGELTGLSARNVATKVHRIKNLLARNFNEAERDAK